MSGFHHRLLSRYDAERAQRQRVEAQWKTIRMVSGMRNCTLSRLLAFLEALPIDSRTPPVYAKPNVNKEAE